MITASLVLYNTPESQIKALLKCINNSPIDFLYIIDNSPVSQIRIIPDDKNKLLYQKSENIGYGAAHNIGIKKAIEAGSHYHIVLNPDISFNQGVIERLYKYIENNEDVVYIMPKVTYPDGQNQYLCKLLPTPFELFFRRFIPSNSVNKIINRRYTLQNSGYDKIMNPPCLSGCFMFLRLSAVSEHSLYFDERFFMYCEDFDLIRRCHRVGKTIFFPEVSIIHDHARKSYTSKKMLWEHIKSAIKYFNKYGWFFDTERYRMNKKILNEIRLIR